MEKGSVTMYGVGRRPGWGRPGFGFGGGWGRPGFGGFGVPFAIGALTGAALSPGYRPYPYPYYAPYPYYPYYY